MSFAAETEKLVNELINAEYLNAVVNFGEKYNSLHEGYAILVEELEEAEDCFKCVKIGIQNIWHGIKSNKQEIVKGELNEALLDLTNTIKELAQVGAVLQKIKNTLEVNE